MLCRSELAREELIGAAFIQETRIIVDVFREQARSYKELGQAPSPQVVVGWSLIFSAQTIRALVGQLG